MLCAVNPEFRLLVKLSHEFCRLNPKPRNLKTQTTNRNRAGRNSVYPFYVVVSKVFDWNWLIGNTFPCAKIQPEACLRVTLWTQYTPMSRPGMSGLIAAHLLQETHDVIIYET